MLALVPAVLLFFVTMIRSLFTVITPPPDSPHAIRTNNLSQALIDELLSSWVKDSVHKYDKSPPSDSTVNSLHTVTDSLKPAATDKHPKVVSASSKAENYSSSTTSPVGGDTPPPFTVDDRPMMDDPLTTALPSGNLFDQPLVPPIPDWDIVLGTYDHYDDNNWENFLIQSEVPLFIRRLLGWSSETLNIRKDILKEPGEEPEDFQLLITTANWLITHQSRFHLRQAYMESDLDGTDSQNTFYFLSNRTLVQNKRKQHWHMFLFRQFDEHGCNMTVVDRMRHLAARRYYKRVKTE